MMSLILNFGLRYWKYIAVILLVAGVFFYWTHRTNTIKKQSQEIVQLKTDVALKIAELESIKKAVDQQNIEIDKLKKRGQVAAKNIEKGPQTCPDSIKYLIDGAKELKK